MGGGFNNVFSNQSKLSPAASYLSPTASAVSRRSRRFFEDDSSNNRHVQQQRNRCDGGVLGTAIPSAAKTTNSGKATGKNDIVDGMNLTHIRSLAREAMSPSVTPSPTMAVFYASIVYAKTQSMDDAYTYAQALSKNGEARRCVRILDQAGLFGQTCSLEKRLEAVLLAAQSMANSGEWEEALQLLEDACVLPLEGNPSTWSSTSIMEDDDDSSWQSLAKAVTVSDTVIHPVARICLWRGRGYDEMSHPPRATAFWRRALLIDAKCVEAFDCLLSRNLITPLETHQLISSMSFDPKMDWLRQIYLSRIILAPQDPEEDKRDPSTSFMNGHVDASSIQMASPSVHEFLSDGMFGEEDERKQSSNTDVEKNVQGALKQLWTVYKLDQSPEMLAMAALRAYRRYDLQGAFEYCQALTELDPLCPKASFVHAATLLALNHKRLLFAMAHEWVEASPQEARSWFAVGCYYYACERYHVAQQHFCRATRLDPLCTEAWIAFGCAFAACDESDQALASFRAAQRLAPAEHAAMLYIGMEYVRTNHLVLGQHSLKSARQSSGGDPLCLHELGVTSFQKRDYEQAMQWFQRVIRTIVPAEGKKPTALNDYIDMVQDDYWEPTLFNLGHCYRKTLRFMEAANCFERCLVLKPVSSLLSTNVVSLLPLTQRKTRETLQHLLRLALRGT